MEVDFGDSDGELHTLEKKKQRHRWISRCFDKQGEKSGVAIKRTFTWILIGMKGEWTGGGLYAQCVRWKDINLHFTGDFNAIEQLNNLLLRNRYHIFHGNALILIAEEYLKRVVT